MELFKTIAFTHKTTELKDIGRLHLGDSEVGQRLTDLRDTLQLNELLYLSTCNRVEFMMVTPHRLDEDFRRAFFQSLFPEWTEADIDWATDHSRVLEGEAALRHLFYVASSIDSLVVGEREIITQVREAYELCRTFGLTGDHLRLLVKSTIETAKRVYTDTQIAQNPVSVVSLAYRKMRQAEFGHAPHILMIGAGQTNRQMAQYLHKAPFGSITVFNRTQSKAEELATYLGGRALPMADLATYREPFDIIITCTGATQPIIGQRLYRNMLGNDLAQKVIVDLALPTDVEEEVVRKNNVNYIGIESLKEQARRNLEQRQQEMERCKTLIDAQIAEFSLLLRQREVELAMREIPVKVRDIRNRATEKVFAKELEALDPASREVLEKVIDYMEKKYISVPMKMAREIIVGIKN